LRIVQIDGERERERKRERDLDQEKRATGDTSSGLLQGRGGGREREKSGGATGDSSSGLWQGRGQGNHGIHHLNPSVLAMVALMYEPEATFLEAVIVSVDVPLVHVASVASSVDVTLFPTTLAIFLHHLRGHE